MPKQTSLKRTYILTLAMGVLWLLLFLARSIWITPWCSVQPTPCLIAEVNGFDRLAFHYGSVGADFASNLLQNTIGVWALALPWILLQKRPRTALLLNLMMVLVTFTNGAFLEIVRAFVQRPRPIILQNPVGEAGRIDHYTSFYSGHTSFVTLACVCTFLWIRYLLPTDKRAQNLSLIACFLFPVVTAILRVWGGRHYPTDTLGAIFFGTLIGLISFQKFKHLLNLVD